MKLFNEGLVRWYQITLRKALLYKYRTEIRDLQLEIANSLNYQVNGGRIDANSDSGRSKRLKRVKPICDK